MSSFEVPNLDRQDDSAMSEGQPTFGLAQAQIILEQLASAFPLGPTRTKPPVLSEVTDAREREIDPRYQTLIEQIPAVVFLAFLDRGIGEAYVSPQIEAILGFSQEEWLNDPVRWYQQIHKDDKARWSSEAAELFLLGSPLKSFYRVLARDGRVVWFHCEAKMVRNNDGQPWFIHGVAFDITELKSAEEALKKSEQMLRGLFESAPDTVVVIDASGSIISVNAQVERMFGYLPQEIVGKHVSKLIPDTLFLQRLAEVLNETIERHSPLNDSGWEFSGRRKNGGQVPVDILLNPLTAAESNMVIGVIRDMTTRKRAEESLRDHAERLKSLSSRLMEVQEAERRNIALELHDEIGQALTGLKLTLDVSTRLPVDEVAANISQAQNLVNELMARVRNLSLALRPAMLDDFGLIPTLLWHIEHYTAQTKVRVNFKHRGLEGRRFGQEVETAAYRIVQEALTNVARHAGVEEANIRLWANLDTLSIQVEDFGSGFDAEAVTARDTSGLAGMRERATLLDGQLNVYSRLGEGTRLEAELNLVREN